LSLPYVAVGILLGAGVFALSEFWVPQSQDAEEEIRARYQTGQDASAPSRQWVTGLGHYNPVDRRSWVVEKYHLFTGEMLWPHIVWLPRNSGQIDIFAERGVWTNGVWHFTKVYRFTYPYPTRPGDTPVPEELPELSLPEFRESPEQIRSEIKINRLLNFKSARKIQLSLREILNYYQLHPTGVPPKLRAVLDTKFHGQIAAAWTCLVVVAISLAFGAKAGRRNVAVGVASSIFICFAYFVLQQLSLAVGSGGRIPAWIAAWTPNILFSLVGLALCWRLR
jgi:lipopolysaccharide export LptBFGC system permease protein LptF